ncbi:MAG TPA: hypothetical protein VND40_04625 [Nitrososphaerales archaeon]|nr:hypothetical protein [Nitrososphaerales archaeon]
MTHHPLRSHHQQTQQRCTVCVLFQSMGRGQYRSSYDREMYLHHLQTAHGVRLSDEQGSPAQAKGDVLRE